MFDSLAILYGETRSKSLLGCEGLTEGFDKSFFFFFVIS